MKFRSLFAWAALALCVLPRLSALTEETAPDARPHRRHHGQGGGDQVTLFDLNVVAPGQLVGGDVVSILGDARVDGLVGGDTTAVFGNTTINGQVRGSVVAVLGDLTLGPGALVGGDAVCIGGHLYRDPTALVRGDVVVKSIGEGLNLLGPARQLWLSGFRHPWVWLGNFALLLLYAGIAWLFPAGVRRCGDVLVQRPGTALIAAGLTLLALPLLFFLLIVSLVGIPVALFALPAAVVLLWIFGKASFYALIGRAISRERLPLGLAVLVGGLVCLLFFLLPVVGLLLSAAISILMMGCVVAALFDSIKKQPSGAGPVPPPLEPPPPPPAEPPAVAFVPPLSVLSAPAATAPVAGFWIRTAALALDGLILGVATTPFHGPAGGSGGILAALAAYGAILWKLRGSTIGGIVCGLKVVRLDDRPLDWPTAIVRALACFLSLIALGLGFLWVIFDRRGQSWQDKIAGTIVIRPAKGVTLV